MHTLFSSIVNSLIKLPSGIRTYLRGVLNDVSIKRYNEQNLLIEGRLKEELLNPNSIKLTLSNHWEREIPNRVEDGLIDSNLPPKYEQGVFTPPSDIMDKRRRRSPWEPTHYSEHEHYLLRPQAYVVIKSNEVIHIPRGIIGVVSPITEKSQSGLIIETETILETGYRDQITFSVCNRNNYAIVLYKGMDIAKISFLKAEDCSFITR